jgi:hypothetical protein
MVSGTTADARMIRFSTVAPESPSNVAMTPSLVGERSFDALYALIGLERLREHRIARVGSVARDSVARHEHDPQAGLKGHERFGDLVPVLRAENDVGEREVVVRVVRARAYVQGGQLCSAGNE